MTENDQPLTAKETESDNFSPGSFPKKKDRFKSVVLVHGWGGTNAVHWQSWLSNELKTKTKLKVFFPTMPNPNFPNLHEWKQVFFKNSPAIDESVCLVGHSLGCPTILRCLEELPAGQQAGLVILVAGFGRYLGIPEIDGFVKSAFDWKKIRTKAKKFVVIYSDNDPFIPVDESEYLAESLGVEPILEHNKGHLTAPEFGPYPRVLDLILKK